MCCTFKFFHSLLFSLTLSFGAMVSVRAQSPVNLDTISWIHGAESCAQNADPALQVVAYSNTTYIIRQNKCLNYEAPFLYLFVGEERALLMDTGAAGPFPLYDTIMHLLAGRKNKQGRPLPLTVMHSHAHSDHTAGDNQFRNRADMQVVGTTRDSVILFFNIRKWPEEAIQYDLGKRQLTLLPIPGHDQTSIAVYDPQTRWLLTGDTVYPGRLYVRD